MWETQKNPKSHNLTQAVILLSSYSCTIWLKTQCLGPCPAESCILLANPSLIISVVMNGVEYLNTLKVVYSMYKYSKS